jgi:chlorite dismutase
MKYHLYIFLQADHQYKFLSPKAQSQLISAFTKTIQQETRILCNTFATLGLKEQSSVLLWLQGESVETMQNFLNTLLHTPLGRYLSISHTLFGMVRQTQYSASGKQEDTNWKGATYLIIYPFTKTHAWHSLDFPTRKKLMEGHIKIGRKYPQISQLLLYSYGIDDAEFIVSYETENLTEFQQLVIELRTDPVRAYTKSDTPIFTCIHKSLEDVLTFL